MADHPEYEGEKFAMGLQNRAARLATEEVGNTLLDRHAFDAGEDAGESTGPFDVCKLLATLPGEQAFRPVFKVGCPLIMQGRHWAWPILSPALPSLRAGFGVAIQGRGQPWHPLERRSMRMLQCRTSPMACRISPNKPMPMVDSGHVADHAAAHEMGCW